MDHIEHFKFLLLSLIIFAPLEALFPRNKDQGLLRKLWTTDALYAALNYLIVSVLSTVFLYGTYFYLSPLTPESFEAAVKSQPLWLQFIEVLIIADLYYYTAHYAAHKLPLLWRFHAVHHSIEHMDWLATHRVHPVDQMLTGSATLIIPIVMGFSTEAMALYALQFSWHSLLKHSNIRVGWGPLRWIICTPAFHHWHHANERDGWDKNFAGQLPILDLIFGTAQMKEKETPRVYGVDDPVPDGYVGQLVYPFRAHKTGTPDEIIAETVS